MILKLYLINLACKLHIPKCCGRRQHFWRTLWTAQDYLLWLHSIGETSLLYWANHNQRSLALLWEHPHYHQCFIPPNWQAEGRVQSNSEKSFQCIQWWRCSHFCWIWLHWSNQQAGMWSIIHKNCHTNLENFCWHLKTRPVFKWKATKMASKLESKTSDFF